jgi:hypothetical protein
VPIEAVARTDGAPWWRGGFSADHLEPDSSRDAAMHSFSCRFCLSSVCSDAFGWYLDRDDLHRNASELVQRFVCSLDFKSPTRTVLAAGPRRGGARQREPSSVSALRLREQPPLQLARGGTVNPTETGSNGSKMTHS